MMSHILRQFLSERGVRIDTIMCHFDTNGTFSVKCVWRVLKVNNSVGSSGRGSKSVTPYRNGTWKGNMETAVPSKHTTVFYTSRWIGFAQTNSYRKSKNTMFKADFADSVLQLQVTSEHNIDRS